jgi:hypothetical protein
MCGGANEALRRAGTALSPDKAGPGTIALRQRPTSLPHLQQSLEKASPQFPAPVQVALTMAALAAFFIWGYACIRTNRSLNPFDHRQ